MSINTDESVAKDVTPEIFYALMKEGKPLILDVRTPEECEKGMIKGAINIDFFSEDFEDQIQKLDPNQTILVYCKGGGRSAKTMRKLKGLEFKTVYNLIGGFQAWPYKDE